MQDSPRYPLRFEAQRENEEVLILTRCHWWAFARTAWLPFLIMILMWVGAMLIQAPLGSLLVFLLSVLLPGIALLYLYLEWRNDSVIVTDQRIIRISRTILAMSRQITEIGLESVHEINFEVPPYDPFARLFSYGTVEIKTAGSQGNLELELMPNPQRFQQIIIEDRQYYESRRAQQRHDLARAELKSWLAGETPVPVHHPAAADDPPRPKAGTNGYLSACIEMTNGDIVYRKHISVWAQHTLIPIVMIVFSLLLLFLTFTLVSDNMRVLTFSLGLASLLIGSGAYYWVDWDWRNDCYIISDDTITLVHKRPLFLQNLRDQILVERIDNVESASNGFFAAMMKYGDVRVSLIGADEHKVFHKVPQPQAIQQEISRRQHNVARRRSRYDALQQRQILGEYLDALHGQTVNQESGARIEAVNERQPSHFDDAARVGGDIDRHRRASLPRKSSADAPRKPAALPAALDRPSDANRRPKPWPPRFRPEQDET